nr:sulfite exporter TauE/SafE family protein [Streptoalloteichus tenebrarius]
MSLVGLLFLCVAAFAAGTVDAVVGGGGLIQLPALMLLSPGGHTIYSLATNKVASMVGTTAALRTYARSTRIEWRSALLMAAAALAGAIGGARVADRLAPGVLNGVVLVAMVGVGYYTWRRRELGAHEHSRFGRPQELALMVLGGAVMGFYDGMTGPGTGSFLVFMLVGLLGFAFLRASATAKIVNIATNLGALVYFVPAGKVLWGLGLTMAACNLAGAVIGASVAVNRGSAFVRRVFLGVVTALVVTIGWKFAVGA